MLRYATSGISPKKRKMKQMKQKILITLLLCIGTVLFAAARPDRDVRIGKKDALTIKPGNFEIVISPKATPVVKWTANDLAANMKEILGTAPEVVTAPTGKVPIFQIGRAHV